LITLLILACSKLTLNKDYPFRNEILGKFYNVPSNDMVWFCSLNLKVI